MTRTELPREITPGDTTAWTEVDSEYPAPTWTVQYFFTSPQETFASAVSIANGVDHDLSIDTSDIREGTYQYQRKVTDGADTFTTERGTVEVLPNLEDDTAGVDRRAFVEVALENVEKALIDKTAKDVANYSLNGRALSRYSFDELRAMRSELRTELRDLRRKERIKRGGKSRQNVKVGFPSGLV